MAMKRSRKQRRVKVKTPSGRVVVHYRKRKKSFGSCAKCGTKLFGVTQARTAASRRNPSRPYGGTLCSRCSRAEIKSKVAK